MKKLGSFFVMLCVINLLALLGLAGYLFGTGRLDGPKAKAIADMLRHKGTPDNFREQLYDILEPATASAPASQMAAAGSQPAEGDTVYSAADRIDTERRAVEQERIHLESEAQDLRHRQELLVQMQTDVQTKLAQIDADKKAFDDRVALTETKAKDENFEKALALYNELKPKQIKDIFIGMTPDLVAKFLQAMEPEQAGKIIAEFKSPEESKFISTVLEQIRTLGTSAASGTPASGNTAAVAPGT
jgi:flagellar motility protein MotE (MotC chaperone)